MSDTSIDIKAVTDAIDWNNKPKWATGIAINNNASPGGLYWVSKLRYSEFITPSGMPYKNPKIYCVNETSTCNVKKFEIIKHLVHDMEPLAEANQPKYSSYHRLIQSQYPPIYDVDGTFLGLMVDAYDVFEGFDPEDRMEAETHALKKLLIPGKRGAKTIIQDIKEAIWSLDLALVKRIHREAKNEYLNK
jgi:hypothetical protein